MWLLVNLTEVSVVANIVVSPAPVLFAASLPLNRQTIRLDRRDEEATTRIPRDAPCGSFQNRFNHAVYFPAQVEIEAPVAVRPI
jgi:hypothetical protein